MPMRMKKGERLALALKIRDVALRLLNSHGKPVKISGYHCVEYNNNGIKIVHMTPFSGCPGQPAPYGLDVWAGKKVLNIIWPPVEIVSFKYGPWMNEFLPGIYKEDRWDKQARL